MTEEEEMARVLVGFNKKYCGLKGNLLALLAIYQIYIFGHGKFDHATHLSIASPDDFINSRLGEVNANLFSNSFSTNLVDIPAMTLAREEKESESEKEKEMRLIIVYVDQRLRPSVRYGRLCQALRSGNLPYLIIGNSKFIESSFLPHTISVYIPPTLSPLMRCPSTLGKEEINKIRSSIVIFWQKHEAAILEKYRNLQTPDWLINRDEDSWPRMLAITEVLDPLLDKAIFTKSILTLAERIIKSRKRDESSIPLEAKVLQATEAFIERNEPMEGSKFYYGPQMVTFIRTFLNLPNLRPEKISEILNRPEGIVINTCRPRREVEGKVIQPTCYQLNKEKLFQAIMNMS